MNYRESSICPVCKTRTYVTVNVSGDYDGQDAPRETNPRECLKCEGIKTAVPEIYKMMLGVWDSYCAQRKEMGKLESKLRRELYDSNEIYAPVFEIGYADFLTKEFQKERKICNKITKNNGDKEDNDWVIGKALSETISAFLKRIKERKEFYNKRYKDRE